MHTPPTSARSLLAAAFVAALVPTLETRAELLGQWRFNETGSLAHDDSGKHNHLVIRRDRTNPFDGHTPDGTGVSGRPGDRAFDPYAWKHYKNGNATSPDRVHADYASLASFTIVAWVRINAVPKQGETLFLLNADNNIKITFYTRDESGWGTLEIASKKFGSQERWLGEDDIGAWVNLAVTYDSTLRSKAVKFYRADAKTPIRAPFSETGNGQATGPVKNIALGGPLPVTLMLGNVADANRTWKGLIDEVRFYNTALGPDELEALRRRSVAVD